MAPRRTSLRLRLTAMAACWCAVALVAAWAMLSALFANQVRQGFDTNLAAQLDGLVAASEWQDKTGPSLRRPLPDPRYEQPLSGWYWQISDASGPLLRSRSLWDSALQNSGQTGTGIFYSDTEGPNGAPLRVAARHLTVNEGSGLVLFQLAGDSRIRQADIARFDRLLALALAILGLGLVAAMVGAVHVGLQPLGRIGRALGDVRAGRAERLEGPFPREIQPLADEIDTLLGHQAAVIGRARSHAGDLAHALKTPLAVLANEAGEDKGEIARQVRQQVVEMQRQVDRHLARSRTAAAAGVLGARCDIVPVVDEIVRVLQRLNQERGINVDLDLGDGLAFAGEREDLQEMLGNLLENAFQWTNGRIRVAADITDDQVMIRVDDDGPGLPAERREEVLARGGRLDEEKPGTGLGLAIVADMAELYSGRLNLEDSQWGGLSVRLELPAAD